MINTWLFLLLLSGLLLLLAVALCEMEGVVLRPQATVTVLNCNWVLNLGDVSPASADW